MKFYKYGQTADLKLQFTVNTKLDSVPEVTKPNLLRFTAPSSDKKEIESLIVKPVDKEIIAYAQKQSGVKYVSHDEEFILRVEDNNVVVYTSDNAGAIYGLMTFLRLLDDDSCFGYSYIWDYPSSSFRGVKIYMPGYDELDDYKALLDMMMYFRHNTIMIEIGGSMEYKRHPEINEGWEEYAEFMSEYSGKAIKLQNGTFPWRKNSIHVYNGGGSYLTQDTLRELIAYTNDRGIKIIPEVPSTSHCDYMLIRRPDLAERPEDPYPDTFCPSNPESYELLFDIFDEVIEVFNPEVINVGHDEFYSLNVCDRCRKRLKKGWEIFAEDLTKIHDYLAEKGVKTMFWCDKLQNVLTDDGMNFGGAVNYVYFGWDPKREFLGTIPATWEARNVIPKDIICMNWFHSFGEKHDEEIREFPVVFGNFRGENMKGGFRKRCGDNTTGGMCSNWAATQPVYLQRNRLYFSMAYNDNLYWNSDYDDQNDDQYEQICNGVFKDLYIYKYGPKSTHGNKYIEVLHTSDRYEWYHELVDGIFASGPEYEKDYYLGDYVVEYTDGTTYNKRIYLGEQVAAHNLTWYGSKAQEEYRMDNPGSTGSRMNTRISEVSYSTLPEVIDGKIYYKYLMENPHPEKEIKSVEFKGVESADWTFEVKSIKY